MTSLFPVFFLLLCLFGWSQEIYAQKRPKAHFLPDAWVQVAMQHKNDTLPPAAWMQFYSWIGYSIYPPDSAFQTASCSFELEEVNLDEDEDQEKVFYMEKLSMDNMVNHGWIGVLDQRNGKWYLVALIEEHGFADIEFDSFIQVEEKHKIFYSRREDIHGYSQRGAHTYFYRMADDRIRECLVLLDFLGNADDDGIIRTGSTDIEFIDHLTLKVTYSYQLESMIQAKKKEDRGKSVTFLEGADYVFYRWNADSTRYVLEIPPGSSLNKEKIGALEQEFTHSFIKAFHREIAYMQQHGTAEQKRYWKQYYRPKPGEDEE